MEKAASHNMSSYKQSEDQKENASGLSIAAAAHGVMLREITATTSAERRAAFAARIGGLFTWEIDAESGDIIYEDGLAELFGLPDNLRPQNMAPFVGQIHSDDVEQVLATFDAAKTPGGHFSAEFRVRKEKGWRWVEGCSQTVLVEGRLKLIGYNRDVDQAHRARAEQELIAVEMKHRVKNVLTVVSAIAQRTFADEAEISKFIGRMQALIASNDMLLIAGGAPVQLRSIVDRVLQNPWRFGARLIVDGEDVPVPNRYVSAIVMGLHELATNAVKYGAWSNESGVVHLAWHLDPVFEKLVILWTEVGGPPVTMPAEPGFGFRLLRSQLRMQLEGDVVHTFHPTGVCCRIECTI